jgi:hypothetical protein
VLAPTEGLDGATLVGRVLQMVLEPTLAVACTGQCTGIVRMTRVGLRWDTRHDIWVGMYGRALRGKVPRHLLGSVCGHMHAHGPGM